MSITSSSDQSVGRCLAILIGINEYRNGVPPLRNAVRDVQAVAELLVTEHAYDVRMLLDEQATLTGLRTLLAGLQTEVTAATRLVLYFAGHGIAEKTDDDASGPQGFLIPQDALRDRQTTFLPMAEVQASLAKLPCRHLLLLLDCCFAGAFRWSQARSLRVRPSTLYRERYERYLRDPAWQVIASAASDELALDVIAGGKLGRRDEMADNSPFATFLCRGLRGSADLRIDGQPGDGVIVANELHIYLESSFERLEQQLKRAVQKPLLWSLEGRDKGQFLFFTPGRSLVLPSALELSEKNNPYRGLEPYEEKNATLFFGRNEVVEKLCQQVQAQPLTVVSGISGSGKSSVVRAGLVSRLRADSAWYILPLVRPGKRLLSALSSVSDELSKEAQGDLTAAVTAWRLANAEKKLLLVIDQLEELVTMGAEPKVQREFLLNIEMALATHGEFMRVVLTLRSDFEPHFAELLAPKPGTYVRFLLRPLNRLELRQVIEGPASERVLYFEPPTLVDQLIDEVAEMPGALPLLSFTMSELYRAYVRSGRSDRCLDAADYQRLNGVAGALSQRADEIFHSLDGAHQSTLRWVMLRMVALDAGEMARRRVPLDELRFGPDHPEEARKQTVLKRLEEARLVVSGVDSEGTQYVEPAHDTLVLGWPQLWNFIKQEKVNIPLQQLLTQEAATWDESKGDREALLWAANPRLPQVLALQDKSPERFNALERDFVRQSDLRRRKLERQKRLRRQVLIAGLLGGIVVLAFLNQRARNTEEKERTQKHEATAAKADAEQRTLDLYVEQGRQLLVEKGNPIEAVLWLHQAYKAQSQSPALRFLLHQAMLSVDAVRMVLSGHNDDVRSARFSPDEQRIVTACEDNTANVFSAESGRLLFTMESGTQLAHAKYSPDGRHIVSSGSDPLDRIWDAVSGKLLFELAIPRSTSTFPAFSPDGRYMLTVEDNSRVQIREADSGKPLRQLPIDSHSVNFAKYSPDGRYILTPCAAKMACLFDAETGRLIYKLRHEHDPYRADYSPDGRAIVTIAAITNESRIWDAETGRRSHQLTELQAKLRQGTLSPDGRRVVLLKEGEERTAQVIDVSADPGLLAVPGQQADAAAHRVLMEFQGHQARILDVTFSADGRRILTASADQTAQVWEVADRRLMMQVRPGELRLDHPSFSADGRSLLAISGNSVWHIDPQDGRLLHALTWNVGKLETAGFSPDGRRIVMLGEKEAQIWDVASAQLLQRLEGGKTLFSDAVYSPDGRHIALIAKNSRGLIWEIETGRAVRELSTHVDHQPLAASYDKEGRHIVTAGTDKTVRIWNAETGKELRVLGRQRHDVLQALYSPDGDRILTTNVDGVVQIWNPDSGQELLNFRVSNGGAVASAMWSPKAESILTLDNAGKARIWDGRTGRLLANVGPYGDECKAAVYNPTRHLFITSHSDGVLRVWDAGPEERSEALISDILKCRVPLKLDEKTGSILPTHVDRQACARLPKDPPIPSAEPGDLLRNSSQAYLRREIVTARRLLVQARKEAESSNDLERLAKITLAEKVFAGIPKAPLTTQLAEISTQVRSAHKQSAAQAEAFRRLCDFALTDLRAPSVALGFCSEAKQLASDREDLAANYIEALLAVGKFKEALTDAQAAFDRQGWASGRAGIAAFAWTAAELSGDSKPAKLWALQVRAAYQQIEPNTKAGWELTGLIDSLQEMYPSSAPLKRHLAVFRLLERPRHPQSDDQQLSEALGLGTTPTSGILHKQATSP